jgi:phage-related protein
LIYDNCEGFRKIVDDVVGKVRIILANLGTNIRNIFAGIGNFIGTTFNNIISTFTNIGKTVGDAISGSVKGAINRVLSTAAKMINGFISAINIAVGVINAIPGVNIKTLAKLEVPKLAKGGIVSSATLAQIGERGREAVLPLENNTEWMDVLADKIASRNGAPSKIVLQLDGKELGWANIATINQITEQTGKLQLRVI